MVKLNILCLEDDDNLAVVMRHYLEDEGMQLSQVSTGAEFHEALKKDTYDAILLDLGLPDVDGLSLVPLLKQQCPNSGIIIISGKTSTTDRVVGLEMGADDYMTKPFEMRELIARIKANVRGRNATTEYATQSQTVDDNIMYHFGNWIYDTGKMLLTDKKGKPIDLTTGECELLQLFLRSKGRALSREYLFEQTRGDNFDSFDRSVDIQVTRLRKKFQDDPSKPTIIKTVRGVGYMFVADVDIEKQAA